MPFCIHVGLTTPYQMIQYATRAIKTRGKLSIELVQLLQNVIFTLKTWVNLTQIQVMSLWGRGRCI